ncbi:MAG: mechanosensitive ion channel domain-containing protein [Halobacteriales archaeon]
MARLLAVDAVGDAFRALGENVIGALPQVLAGLLFLVVAGLLIRVVVWALERTLARTLRGESPIYRQFVVTVVSVFMWFGALLSFLSIVGLEGIASSLGTATGFVALGVAYALSGMIADVVAGTYLLRDPDFNPGDAVVVDGMAETLRSIELRKTRFDVEGDRVVLANSDIEGEWRRVDGADE